MIHDLDKDIVTCMVVVHRYLRTHNAPDRITLASNEVIHYLLWCVKEQERLEREVLDDS